VKIRSDVIKIQTADRDLGGAKVEPEEKPVSRVIRTSAPLSPHGNPQDVRGEIPTEVILDAGSISDLARGAKRLCKDCVWFNQKDWQKAVKRIEKTSDVHKRQEINNIRAALLMTKNAQLATSFEDHDGDLDVEVALMVAGKCQALSEITDDLIVVFPQGCCPDVAQKADGSEIPVVTLGSPNGYFKPASRESKKEQNKIYDQLLRAAQNKRP